MAEQRCLTFRQAVNRLRAAGVVGPIYIGPSESTDASRRLWAWFIVGMVAVVAGLFCGFTDRLVGAIVLIAIATVAQFMLMTGLFLRWP